MENNLNILDCTLRDGGYYNNWDFPNNLVDSYLKSISASNIDIIEIGFRSLIHDRFVGAFAFSSDEYISALTLPSGVKLAVMLNAKEIIANQSDTDKTLSRLFAPKADSPVDLVRIATTVQDLVNNRGIAAYLKKLGYQVSLNIMQVSTHTPDEITAAIREINEWGSVDVIYLADSLGNMQPEDIDCYIGAIRSEWKGDIGVHTHDNLGQAQANAMQAITSGASWVDATILGMGRGAGNVRTEHLLVELNKNGYQKYNPDAVFPLVIEHFSELKSRYDWGQNLLYYLSATYGIHPTYVQELLSKRYIETHHIISALEYLKNSGAKVYENDSLEKALQHSNGTIEGTWSAKGWVEGSDLLIIGPGKGTARYRDALIKFIEKHKPVVISLNVNTQIPQEYITAYAACHNTRILMDLDKYANLKKPIIMPYSSLPEFVREMLDDVEIMDYGMVVNSESFEVKDSGCILPYALVAPYSFAIGMAGDANRILLAGFDGYEPNDPRQLEMSLSLQCYKKMENNVPVLSVTPTTYDVDKSSIFSPEL